MLELTVSSCLLFCSAFVLETLVVNTRNLKRPLSDFSYKMILSFEIIMQYKNKNYVCIFLFFCWYWLIACRMAMCDHFGWSLSCFYFVVFLRMVFFKSNELDVMPLNQDVFYHLVPFAEYLLNIELCGNVCKNSNVLVSFLVLTNALAAN